MSEKQRICAICPNHSAHFFYPAICTKERGEVMPGEVHAT